MDSRALLTLATTAKDEFVEVEEVNANIKQLIEGQNVLINDYAESMPDIDQTEKAAADLDTELQQVEEQLSQSQDLLLQLLQSKPQEENSKQADNLLKAILTNFTAKFTELTKSAVSKGQASVTVFQLIEIEEEITKLIENLEKNGMYPESPEENEKRSKKAEEHTVKLAEFLQLLKQVISQAQQRQQQQQEEGAAAEAPESQEQPQQGN